jgi:hypothetical protein
MENKIIKKECFYAYAKQSKNISGAVQQDYRTA